MKKLYLLLFSAFILITFCGFRTEGPFKEGDIFFQTSGSQQAKAIELATHSRFSHVGIYLLRNGKPYILEAVGPVKYTPLNEFIAEGKKGQYAVMRLKNRDKLLTEAALQKIHTQAEIWKGKDYDLYFDWSDDKLYCSELVWKLYKTAGIEVGAQRKFKDYDFTNPLVKAQLEKRFGKTLPMNETIVAPEDIYTCPALESVSRD